MLNTQNLVCFIFKCNVIRVFSPPFWGGGEGLYKTQMGTILWQIIPIHFKTTEIVYRARLRLLWPAILILSNHFRPCTLWFSLLQLNFWAVRSVYASTFLNEVSLSDKIGFLAVWSFFIDKFWFPLFVEQYCFVGRSLFHILPGDSILKELLDFLSDDCLNFDFPDCRVQTSAFPHAVPKVGKKWFRIQLRNFSRFHDFKRSFISHLIVQM